MNLEFHNHYNTKVKFFCDNGTGMGLNGSFMYGHAIQKFRSLTATKRDLLAIFLFQIMFRSDNFVLHSATM